jgi:hypothetical protein
MLKIIFLSITFICSINCLEIGDFCLKTSPTKCEGKHKIDCGNGLCSKYAYSCAVITNEQKNNETFKTKIKECATSKYKWNPNDVCLNSKMCISNAIRLWSFNQIKEIECRCKGKYVFRCVNDYCASDKRACDDLKQHQMKIKIKKCPK